MAQRTILIQKRAHLCISNGLLTIEQDNRLVTIALEDIWVVIIESRMVTVTAACLSKLVDAGIGVVFCGSNHMPNGLLLPLGVHCRHALIAQDQLTMTKPMKKRLWQRIVQAKINNQAAVMEELGLDASLLRSYAQSVLSGDTNNREAAAASAYFKAILEDGNRRTAPQSSALDYGYSILRAGIGRVAVGGGWLVSQGIHHHNLYNSFNLVDDLIEPFRPLIDLIILTYGIEEPLSSQSKVLLARVFEFTMLIDGKRCGCQQCMEVMISSLRTAVLEKDPMRLLLPKISGLDLVGIE